MSRPIRPLLSALSIVIGATLVPAMAAAQSDGPGFSSRQERRAERRAERQQRRAERRARRAERRAATAAPELDPTAGSAAVLLVAGAAIVLFDRRRRQA